LNHYWFLILRVTPRYNIVTLKDTKIPTQPSDLSVFLTVFLPQTKNFAKIYFPDEKIKTINYLSGLNNLMSQMKNLKLSAVENVIFSPFD